jgi:P27 family predicted phage terminase small subunit
MPNRRTPATLKIRPEHLRGLRTVPEVAAATVGGIGLDWSDVPAMLDATARAEWVRLGQVYANHATRFREGDRVILSAYCIAWGIYVQAAAELAVDGLLVKGRSAPDRGRRVRSPAMTVWVQAGTQLRHLASALGLSPDARGRSGIDEAAQDRDPRDVNPFLAPTGVPS